MIFGSGTSAEGVRARSHRDEADIWPDWVRALLCESIRAERAPEPDVASHGTLVVMGRGALRYARLPA
jgi:hypothetical protein